MERTDFWDSLRPRKATDEWGLGSKSTSSRQNRGKERGKNLVRRQGKKRKSALYDRIKKERADEGKRTRDSLTPPAGKKEGLWEQKVQAGDQL